MSSQDSESPSNPERLSRKELRMARIRGEVSESSTPSLAQPMTEQQEEGDFVFDPEENLIPPKYDVTSEEVIAAGLSIPDSVMKEHTSPADPLETFDSKPEKEDLDVDTSVLSNIESLRTRVDTVSEEFRRRDSRLDLMDQRMNTLKTVIDSFSPPPDDSNDLKDVVGALVQQVKEMRIEITALETRIQENQQLYEIKQKREASSSEAAPIHAVLTDVPSVMTTPGIVPKSAETSVPRVRRKAVVYGD